MPEECVPHGVQAAPTKKTWKVTQYHGDSRLLFHQTLKEHRIVIYILIDLNASMHFIKGFPNCEEETVLHGVIRAFRVLSSELIQSFTFRDNCSTRARKE